MLNIIEQRLYNQQLEQPRFKTPKEIVAWLGAVQAQEYALAKWALAMRLEGFKEAEVEQAFTEGSILRTHALRPTWHFVTPEDIRWILQLTAPRVHAINGTMYRQLELDETLLKRSADAIVNALAGGKQLTRVELGEALAQIGIEAEGMRLGYIVHYAELEAIICSGARRGNQFTYALIAERAPQAKILPRDEALAELVKRFFTSHGPAMVHDFVKWSGLTVADTKAGIEMCRSYLTESEFEGKSYWHHTDTIPYFEISSPTVYLLPPYDEYTIAFKDTSAILNPDFIPYIGRTFTAFYAIDGQLAGMWKRKFSQGAVVIEAMPFRPLNSAEKDAFQAAAERFGDFLAMPVSVEMTPNRP